MTKRAQNQVLMRQTGDEWSESKLEDIDSTHNAGTWDGRKGKVSLPNLNEKSTANDAWIWMMQNST